MKIDNFFFELKRRNVIRFAGLYLVGAWLLVQVAGTVLSMFGRARVAAALLRLDPMFDSIRNDPRFQKLCEEKPK